MTVSDCGVLRGIMISFENMQAKNVKPNVTIQVVF